MNYNKVLLIVGAIMIFIGGALILVSELCLIQVLTVPGIIVLSLGSLTMAVSSLVSPKRPKS